MKATLINSDGPAWLKMPANMLRRLFATVLILLMAVGVCPLVYAEQPPPKPQTGPPAATHEQADKDQAEAETRLEEFVPNEEVSIDKSVAFPVDI